jgi:hypothetical protein
MDTPIYDGVLNVIYYFISTLGLEYFAKYGYRNNFFPRSYVLHYCH